MEEVAPRRRKGTLAKSAQFAWLLLLWAIDRLVDLALVNGRIFAQEASLFIGVAVLSIGLLSFESAKYCDGNTAEYLSCTRPSTYYYFDALDIFLVIVGISCILLWWLKRKR